MATQFGELGSHAALNVLNGKYEFRVCERSIWFPDQGEILLKKWVRSIGGNERNLKIQWDMGNAVLAELTLYNVRNKKLVRNLIEEASEDKIHREDTIELFNAEKLYIVIDEQSLNLNEEFSVCYEDNWWIRELEVSQDSQDRTVKMVFQRRPEMYLDKF